MVRDFVAVGDNEVAGDELIAERRAECDKQVARAVQKVRAKLQIVINIGFELLKILF